MKHFAIIDENNMVLNCIIVSDNDCGNYEFPQSDLIGSQFCHNIFGGTWLETSEFGLFRGRFASPGDYYDPIKDEFYIKLDVSN
jgi:hypothetical protein